MTVIELSGTVSIGVQVTGNATLVAAAAVVEEVHGLPDAVQEAIFRAAGGVVDLIVHYAIPAFQHIEDARLELVVIFFLGLAIDRAAKSLARTPSVLPAP